MSASVRIESGISAGTHYWIDRPVLRIGSDPQCEICLPTADLAPHALTLEFRDGTYRAYNRGSSPVSIGATVVNPGANAVWPPDATAQLPGDLRLVLEVDGDPRPSPRQEPRLEDGFVDDVESRAAGTAAAGSAGDAAAKKKKSSTLVQLAVIGICVVMMAGFLLLKPGGGETAAPNRPSFDAIVRESLAKDEASRAVVRRLQYAQAALVRGNTALARERFLYLRDQLMDQDESLSAEDQADAKRILAYVEYRLGQ